MTKAGAPINGKPPAAERRVNWKKNLAVIWLSQFLSIAGFSFAMPFAPYYIQDLGVTDPARLKFWVSVFAAATPLTLAVFSPVWGALADRYGRRLMLLRANFAGAVVVALMGLTPNVQVLVLLRLLQGMFTGTMTAAQTMVSVNTPERRSGLALGALSAAVFSGGMAGAFIGGFVADLFGFRHAFIAGGGLLLSAGLLVLFGTTESVDREGDAEDAPARLKPAADEMAAVMPILVLIVAMAFVRQFDSAFLPLLVQDIHGSLRGVSVWTGALSAAGGIAGLLAGPLLGRLADRISPPRIGKLSALGAGLLMIPQGLAAGFGLLFAARFGTVFCAGGLDPVFQIWLAKITPAERRGLVFGWSGTARSIGWIIAPLASGVVAAELDIRSVFFAGAALYVALIPGIGLAVRRLQRTRA